MLRMSLFASVLLLTACATAAEESASAAGERDCFNSEVVSGYTVIDRHSIEVRVSPSRRYILTTDWATNNLDFSEHVALRSATGRICTGNGLGVEIIGGSPVRNYPVQSVARAPQPAPADHPET